MDKQVGKSNSTESIFSTKGGRTEPDAIEVPKIELPKGGGAVRGIDEEFKVNAANGTASFELSMRVNASRLPIWKLNGGSLGGTGSLLQSVEFDGYLTLAEGTDQVHLALP